jgi:ElaB/YqjD/DUF883 family membrane-anchored ribosome-binding protein
MATAARTSSTSRALNGASRSAKRVVRRAETKGYQLTNFLSREASAIGRRAGDLYSSTATATRKHPIAAVGIVTGVAALLGGLWYAARNR